MKLHVAGTKTRRSKMTTNPIMAAPARAEQDVSEVLLPSGREGFGISAEARRHLDDQVRAAGGDLDAVAQEIHARIVAIDATPTPQSPIEGTRLQAERAFHVARLSYLELVANKASRA
jgi:hypothetical protein